MDPREDDSVVDLESGETETTSEEDGSKDMDLGFNFSKRMVGKIESKCKNFYRSTTNIDGLGSSKNMFGSMMNLEVLVGKDGEKASCFLDKKLVDEKQKKISSKMPPKPPRPPKGPCLDAADMKLVKEISELARLKHARIKSMRTLKKMRAEKTSSSNINLFALLVTILFCFVIIFQGILGSHV